MTNLQLLLSMGVPTLAVLISHLFTNARITAIDTNLNGRMDRIESRLTVIEGDLRQFYRDLGAHEAKISSLKSRLRPE
jgi:hypothetical protein